MATWTRAEARAAAAALLAALVPSAAAAPPVAEASLSFARHGESVATHELVWLRDAVPERTVTVFEPYEAREVTFRALPFAEVLDRVYGPGWREEEELLFTCRDGYQPTVPVARAQTYEAWLAFARPDAEDFAIDKLESGRVQRVPLGPFYLIWDNRDQPLLRREGDYGWPYQLVGVDLVRTRERFPRMTPPDDAGPEVRAGFEAFRVHCSRCHRVHGEGGTIGPELAEPGREAGLRDPVWLRRWIDDPSRFAASARMPPLNPQLPGRERTIDAIIAYLRAIAEARPPGEPAPPGRSAARQ